MCDPWKLAASAGVIAGSAYHFWDKYINVERKVEEIKVVEGKAICTKETCPCVMEDCKRPPPKTEPDIGTEEERRKRCKEIKEEMLKKRAEDREHLAHSIKTGQEKAEMQKAKKLENAPKSEAEEPQKLGHEQKKDDGKGGGKSKAPAKDSKAEDKTKAPAKDSKAEDKTKAAKNDKKVDDSKSKAKPPDKNAKENKSGNPGGASPTSEAGNNVEGK